VKYLLVGIALTGVMFAAPRTLAADPLMQNPSVAAKRQMIGCMTKRMLASRTVSYNDARKACIAQLKPTIDNSSHPLTAAR
jgi:hypothetical protein